MSGSFLGESDKAVKQLWKPINEKAIFPVYPADKLLNGERRQKIISRIKELVDVPDEHFDALYLNLINNFAEFVQILPVNNEARLCSLLDEGLFTSHFALKALLSDKNKKISHVMAYVLFSATLLANVGDVLKERYVAISNKKGEFVRNWVPFDGSMQPADGYFRVWRGGGFVPWVCSRLKLVFAKQIMPEIGFNWIASDAHVLAIWLALLSGDKEGGGALWLIFAQAMEWINEFRESQEYSIPVQVESVESEETELGVEFLQWIPKEAQVSINKPNSKLHIIKDGGGVLLTIAAIQKFINEKHPAAKVENILDSVEKLGVPVEKVKYKILPPKEAIQQTVSEQPVKQSTLFGGLHAPHVPIAKSPEVNLSDLAITEIIKVEGKEGVVFLSGHSKILEAVGAALLSQLAPNTNIIFKPIEALASAAKLALGQDLPKLEAPFQSLNQPAATSAR